MNKEFWLERWERQEIGFHQDAINPCLRQYWNELRVAHDAAVFVPLCGKSLDLLWLHKQGHPVLGVELSAIAVQAFFQENGHTPHRSTTEKFEHYKAGGFSILSGDFFDLRKDDLAEVCAVYDRASLIALPPEMRERYVRHLVNILPPATRILLLTFDYPQSEMSGPPFAVSVNEVETLFRGFAEIRLLAQLDALPQNQRLHERGVRRLQENIFLLTLR